MKISFALALSEEGIFEKRHFGDSDKFAIYTSGKHQLSLKEELANTFKLMDEVQEHGSKKKADAIISFLKEKGVSVLVSKQFGQNINRVNQHFVPVIIAEDKPDIAIKVLLKHMNWFEDELKNRKENYMLFHIKNGVLKTNILKD